MFSLFFPHFSSSSSSSSILSGFHCGWLTQRNPQKNSFGKRTVWRNVVKNEFVKIQCVCSICDFFFPFHQNPVLSDFCRRRRRRRRRSTTITTKCLSCSWQCKRKFIKIIKINNQNAACKQSGSNLVMPMEKSYMDIQAAAAAELPLQVSNFWWVWVKRWIILLCDECAMLVCVVVLFVCTSVVCVCVWSFVFVLFFFFWA